MLHIIRQALNVLSIYGYSIAHRQAASQGLDEILLDKIAKFNSTDLCKTPKLISRRLVLRVLRPDAQQKNKMRKKVLTNTPLFAIISGLVRCWCSSVGRAADL